jgi:hypothetical protein
MFQNKCKLNFTRLINRCPYKIIECIDAKQMNIIYNKFCLNWKKNELKKQRRINEGI